jgi:hypothetical protein
MLIKESTLRRIIMEEARRVLREADEAIIPATPAPNLSTTIPGGAVKVNIKRPAGYVDPNAPVVPLTVEEAPQAVYNAINAAGGRYKTLLLSVWDRFSRGVAQGQSSVLKFQFQINTDGSIDPKTIKLTCTPDFTIPAVGQQSAHTLSGDFKKTIAGWSFARVAEAFIYEHPKGMEFNSREY